MLDLKALLSKILNPPVAAKGNASGRINLFGLLIQWGSNTQAVSSSSTVSWNTTFGKAYAYTPIIFTQIVNTSAPATFHVSANNITRTGCTWLRQSSLSTSYNCTIHWVAIGFSNGGGYLTSKFYEIFSHLERWWEHVRLKGFVGANPRHVRSSNIQHNLGWDNGSNEKALRSSARCHLEPTNCCGWNQYDWDTAGRMETRGGLCVDDKSTEQHFKWCRDTLYNQRIKWCVHCIQLRLCLDKQRLKYDSEFHIYNITPNERGCLAC